MTKQAPIDKFEGTYRWLSNFWPVEVELDGEVYPSVENAYQAAKTLFLSDRDRFRICSAKAAKRYGKGLEIRPDWDEIKVTIMRDLLRQKFAKPEFKILLSLTGDAELIEGNWWGDRFWGVCKGTSENHLGRLIMEIRDEQMS